MTELKIFITVMLLVGCGWLGTAVRTVVDVADALCMLAASERSDSEKEKTADSAWCAEHAAEYVDEVTRAKAAAGKRAGLSVEER